MLPSHISKETLKTLEMPSVSQEKQFGSVKTELLKTQHSTYINTPVPTKGKLSHTTFDFDLTSLPNESTDDYEIPLPVNDFLPISGSVNDSTPQINLSNPPLTILKLPSTEPPLPNKVDLRINIPDQPTLVVQSPKTPTLSRKLKAISLDSDTNPTNSQTDCLEVPRDVFSMPNTPKRQIPKSQLHKFGVRSHSGSNLGGDSNLSSSSNLSSLGSNQSISGSQTLKTLPEIMTLSDFSQGRSEPIRIKAKGLLERRGSNVSLTIDLGAAEVKSTVSSRLNSARSVSNLNLSNIESDVAKCSCKSESKCECLKKDDCKRCRGNLKKFQKLSTESCLCDEAVTSTVCRGYKMCQYSRLGCLNYLSYVRRKSLSNENLYIGPSHEFKKMHKKSEYPRNMATQINNQILSEDFQLHLQNIQYLQTAGNVLSKKQLKENCKTEHLKDLHKEFWELPQNFQEKSFVTGSQSKNRYKTILPNEHSRVVLDLGPGRDCNGAEGYINANYIKGYDYTETAYIATQGPLPHTTADLWQMVIQSNTAKVVMLTPLQEKGRIKCEMYFPEKLNDVCVCGKFEIMCVNVHEENSYTVRTLEVTDTSITTACLAKKEAGEISMCKKYCCDKMRRSGIECKKYKKYIDNANCQSTSIQPIGSKNVGQDNKINEENRLNESTIVTSIKDDPFIGNLVTGDEDLEDDIFVGTDFKFPGKPRKLIRSRDFKFSDDFTDYFGETSDTKQNVPSSEKCENSKINNLNESITDNINSVCSGNILGEIKDSDKKISESCKKSQKSCYEKSDGVRFVQHYWYQTWPDHNLANTEEILALALDVLDLKNEAMSLYTHTQPSQNKRSSTVSTNYNNINLDSKLCTSNFQNSNVISKPDDNVPVQTYLATRNDEKTENVPPPPVVVHCSAGIGRTGCFLAILNGIQQLKHNMNVDVLAIVCSLRLNRGGMVQTAEQYELIHKVLALYGEYVDK